MKYALTAAWFKWVIFNMFHLLLTATVGIKWMICINKNHCWDHDNDLLIYLIDLTDCWHKEDDFFGIRGMIVIGKTTGGSCG
jgi:hypothetical protein